MSSNGMSPIEFEGNREKFSVVLPCEPEHFSKFVASLLGRPQVISGRVPGPFEISRPDIENIYHLVNQHVYSQDNSTLISFSLRIIYNDHSSVTLNDIEEFRTYNEVRPLKSTGVVLSWIYLVKFRLKDAPEKQQIDISLNAGFRKIDTEPSSSYPIDRYASDDDRVSYRISHTNRSWGAAVQSLIVNQLSCYAKPLVGVLRIFNDYSILIGLISGFIIFVIFTLIGLSITGEFVARYTENFGAISASSNASYESLDNKITHLTNMISSGVWARYSFYGTFFVLASLIFSIGLGSWIGTSAAFSRKSFIALTKASEDELKAYPEEIKNHWIYFSFSLITSLFISLLVKLIFAVSSRYFGI